MAWGPVSYGKAHVVILNVHLPHQACPVSPSQWLIFAILASNLHCPMQGNNHDPFVHSSKSGVPVTRAIGYAAPRDTQLSKAGITGLRVNCSLSIGHGVRGEAHPQVAAAALETLRHSISQSSHGDRCGPSNGLRMIRNDFYLSNLYQRDDSFGFPVCCTRDNHDNHDGYDSLDGHDTPPPELPCFSMGQRRSPGSPLPGHHPPLKLRRKRGLPDHFR